MISVLVPTLNRSSFVVRLLRYYKNVGFSGEILIGDSSDCSHAEEIKREIKSVTNSLNVKYVDCSGLNDSEAIEHLSQCATTPYVAFVGDDDFLVPNGLSEAVEFLEGHPEYSVAHGDAALCILKSTGAYGQVQSTGVYTLGTLEQPTASQRLYDHLSSYFVTLFSVHRTEQHRSAYKDISNLKDKSFTELLPSCIPIIQGKAKQLVSLYLVRQVHDQRYLLPTVFDWITSPDWQDSYTTCWERLSEELAHQDGIEIETARGEVKHALSAFLAKRIALANGTQKKPSRFREVVKKVSFLQSSWRRADSFMPGEEHQMSLPSLLRRSSPFNTDFLPVHQAMANQESQR